MRTHQTLEEKIHTWMKALVTNTSIETVMFTNQNGAEPKTDYLAVNIDSMTTDMPPEIRYKNLDLQKQIEENAIYRGVVTLQFRINTKENAMELAEEVKTRMWMTNSVEFLESVNLGLHTVGDTTNASFLESERNRNRADISVMLHYTATYQDIIQTIGKVTVLGYDAETGNKIVDVTVEEPGYTP